MIAFGPSPAHRPLSANACCSSNACYPSHAAAQAQKILASITSFSGPHVPPAAEPSTAANHRLTDGRSSQTLSSTSSTSPTPERLSPDLIISPAPSSNPPTSNPLLGKPDILMTFRKGFLPRTRGTLSKNAPVIASFVPNPSKKKKRTPLSRQQKIVTYSKILKPKPSIAKKKI